jgi:beta-lactamase regulating signal transducer with metallopeptidase domain
MAALFLIYTLVDHKTQLEPSTKYNIATIFQCIGGIQFIYLLSQPRTKINTNISFLGLGNMYMDSLLPYLGIFYLIILLFYFVHFIYQCFHLQTIKKTANFSEQHKWESLLYHSNIEMPSKLKIGFSQRIESPIVFGILEPIILLPVSICTYLSPAQIKLILLHELAHINRFDFLIHIVLKTIHCFLWFNPFVHALQKRIQLQREMACDAFVVNKSNDPVNYSKALFYLSEKVYLTQLNVSLGAYSNQSELLTRIQFLNKIPTPKKLNFKVFILIPLLAFCTTFFLKTSKEKIVISRPSTLIRANTTSIIESNNKLSSNRHIKVSFKRHKYFANNENQWTSANRSTITDANKLLHYNDLLNETKTWVKSFEGPAKFAGYDENAAAQDSLENAIIEKVLLSSIIKNYQLKKTLLEQKLGKASNLNEASDYLMNSKEWAEIQQYQQWVREYLQKQ